MMRRSSDMVVLDDQPLNPQALRDWLALATPQGVAWPQQPPCDWDGALSWPELGRFRVNLLWHAMGPGLVLRPVATQVPSLAGLGAPEALAVWAAQSHGLVLVTGPTGSGKSSTLAAMVDHINRTQAAHVLTLEDPIEFVHTSARSLITQREIGRDTRSFELGLRAALREDPDVILIGELRDTTTIRLALTAAETGHLVLASLHTSSAAASVSRLVDVFDAAEKALVQTQLSQSLLGVASQTLCRTADSTQRIAAFEMLVATPAVRSMIRDNKLAQLDSALQTGAQWGMNTLAQDLQRLRQRGSISADEVQHKLRSVADGQPRSPG